jgi:hypothetical protein
MKKLTSLLAALILLTACSNNKISELDFMVGTWKMENKEQYEVWEKSYNNELAGYSYRIKNDQKSITETLSIKLIGDQIVYEATVPDQNEGKTIGFTLNDEMQTYLSFENLQHDFPKKIQYKKISENEIEVTVLGDAGKGFSYTQFKLIEE